MCRMSAPHSCLQFLTLHKCYWLTIIIIQSFVKFTGSRYSWVGSSAAAVARWVALVRYVCSTEWTNLTCWPPCEVLVSSAGLLLRNQVRPDLPWSRILCRLDAFSVVWPLTSKHWVHNRRGKTKKRCRLQNIYWDRKHALQFVVSDCFNVCSFCLCNDTDVCEAWWRAWLLCVSAGKVENGRGSRCTDSLTSCWGTTKADHCHP